MSDTMEPANAPRWLDELVQRANRLVGLNSSSSSKYDELKTWLRRELNVVPAVAYLSDAQKQWTARVGQLLMSMPTLMVLLVEGEDSDDYVWRLHRLHAYVRGLGVTVVLVGHEGEFRCACIVSVDENEVAAQLGARTWRPADAEGSGGVTATKFARLVERCAGQAYVDLPTADQVELTYRLLLGLGALPVDDAIRHVARRLRELSLADFQRVRVGGPLYRAIGLSIKQAARHGFTYDRPRRLHVRAVRATTEDFELDDWIACVRAVVTGEPLALDEVLRAATEHAVEYFGLRPLAFRRGGRVERGIREAVDALVARGELSLDADEQLRATSTLERPTASDESSIDSPDDSEEPDGMDAAPVDAGYIPDPDALRALLGSLPPESEVSVQAYLALDLFPPEDLRDRMLAHLAEFEEAFDREDYVDLPGAEELFAWGGRLLDRWDRLSDEHRSLVQAAILYFVDSSEADDDFALDGLRTDKAVMNAVLEVVGREP